MLVLSRKGESGRGMVRFYVVSPGVLWPIEIRILRMGAEVAVRLALDGEGKIEGVERFWEF